jgi:hypothetical protein
MTEDEKQKLMEHYGIITEHQPVYRYAGFRTRISRMRWTTPSEPRGAQTSRAGQRSPARRQGLE